MADHIEVFYNRQRIHSGPRYKTPLEVATEYQQKLLTRPLKDQKVAVR